MLTWLVATVLLVLAIALGLTLVLLPVGLLLGWLSFRLYAIGLKLMLPRSRDVTRAVHKEWRGWQRKPLVRKLRRTARAGSSKLGKRGRRLARKYRS